MKQFFLDLYNEYLLKLLDILLYIPRRVFDEVLQAIADVIADLDPPDFLTQYQITDYIPADIVWLLHMSEFDTCLGIIASGITFYFARRILTLGIW